MAHPDDDDRLDSLDGKLREARARSAERPRQSRALGSERGNALGLAFRVSVEVVSALAMGLGIGWLLDYWLDTRPWLMLVFIVLGACAGMLNVYRVARGFGYAVGYEKPADADKDGQERR